jgi:hypothetical protein
MANRYVLSAVLIIVAVFSAYLVKFYFILDYSVSNTQSVWGNFGDYAGGILNPILSFITIVLLIKSLDFQKESNNSLEGQLAKNEQLGKLRSFESLFFNMIDAQKNLFDSFQIVVPSENSSKTIKCVKAVIEIELEIERIRENDGGDDQVLKYLKAIDSTDQIFGLSRAIYVTVLLISKKLSDDEGFSLKDREDHFSTLINFTDFAQLRLAIICVQFLDYKSAKYLRQHDEFKNIAEKLGLKYDSY